MMEPRSGKTIGDLHERNARLYPEREAIVHGARRVTYAALLTRIRRLSSAIERAGARRQHRIGILSTNNVEYLEVYGAAEWAGFICANYNFRSAGPEVAHLVADSAPGVVFFEDVFAALIEPLRASYPGVLKWVCIGQLCPEWATPYETFIASGDAAGGRLRACASDWAHLFYTSGTTGRPKGVPIRHSGWLAVAGRLVNVQETVLLQMTPLFHVGGRGPTLTAAWASGKIVLHKTFSAPDFLTAVECERVNTSFMVAPMIQAVLDHPDFARHDLSSLAWVMSASAPIPGPLLRRAIAQFGNIFYLSYGSTECGSIARLRRAEVTLDGGAEQTRRLASVGHVEPWVDARLLDDDGQEVAQGAVGEVCVISSMFEQYWNNSNATIDAMHGRYFRTGDMGIFDERGYLFLVDRKKDMILSGGENIYSREVEDALESHPDVAEAAVVGRRDPKWGESVLALVIPRADAALDVGELGRHVATRIARYKCPKEILIVADLPRHGTGKVDKVAIRRDYAGP